MQWGLSLQDCPLLCDLPDGRNGQPWEERLECDLLESVQGALLLTAALCVM